MANGNPEIVTIAAIQNIEVPLILFMTFPPLTQSGEELNGYKFRTRNIFMKKWCNAFEVYNSVWGSMGDGIGLEVANVEISDEEIVKKVIGGDTALFEILMRRYNQRLFRVARSLVKNDLESEDNIQDAYVKAYEHLDQFEGRARFSTWLTKIALYDAYGRVRRIDQQKVDSLSVLAGQGLNVKSKGRDPEQQSMMAN